MGSSFWKINNPGREERHFSIKHKGQSDCIRVEREACGTDWSNHNEVIRSYQKGMVWPRFFVMILAFDPTPR